MDNQDDPEDTNGDLERIHIRALEENVLLRKQLRLENAILSLN